MIILKLKFIRINLYISVSKYLKSRLCNNKKNIYIINELYKCKTCVKYVSSLSKLKRRTWQTE